MRNFLDTSAILNGAIPLYNNINISSFVLSELENLKTNETNEHSKYLARQIVRDIICSNEIKIELVSQKKVNKIMQKYDFLLNINDSRIIAEAVVAAKNEQICLITSDYLQYLTALQIAQKIKNFSAKYFEPQNENKEEYCGWRKFYPELEEMALLYSNPEINTLKLKTNEFAEIYENENLKDILFWNGEKYTQLVYRPFKNKFLNETISPRNIEQKMAFHLLLNPDIKVKLLTSAWGSGKTLLALSYALDQIGKGHYSKLIFLRNNIIAADTNDIGHLPGNLRDKLSIWSTVLADHLGGQEMLDQLIDEGYIETIPISHIRGRSIKSSIVICDECENMNDKLITLVLSRIEEDSEIIFCGDVAQIDNKKFEKNNGIRAMIKSLAGNPLFGMVKLIKSERGPVASLCDLIRPPV